MTKVNLDQYATLKAKPSLTPEETAVMNALVAVSEAESAAVATIQPVPPAVFEANDVLEDTQEALVAKPATT